MTELILGADGGGTKTSLAAVDLSGGKVAHTFGQSINSYVIPMDEAVENFKKAVLSLKLPRDRRIRAVSIGDPAMDDSGGDALAEEFRFKIKNCGIFDSETQIYSRSDAFMALYGLCGEDPGVLLISGTGSMGIAADNKGGLFTVGGWGAPSSDNGSGYDIAVKAINAVFDAFDGISPGTLLTQAALSFFKAERARDLIPIFNGKGLTKTEIAAFAVSVSECAQSGDETALNILVWAGNLLGDYAVSLMRRINEETCPVGMFGGVFVNNETVRRHFIQSVRQKFKDADIRFPSVTPEYAAAKYVLNRLKSNAEKGLIINHG